MDKCEFCENYNKMLTDADKKIKLLEEEIKELKKEIHWLEQQEA